jgi:four helix bundle protein
MNAEKNNPIVKLSFEFALEIIEFCELLEQKRKFVLAQQVLKSGTSIGANVWESQNSESLADFIHKMKIGSKEANETSYWLSLCKYSKNYPASENLILKLESLMKILSKIISTSKKKLK